MKGLFIPEITAEMFKNGCLESIEALVAEGKIYDIDYQQPCDDCISRQEVINCVTFNEFRYKIVEDIKTLPSVTPKGETGWIPVSERLPERNKEVIVTDIETSDTYLSRYIGNGYWECDNGLFKNRIIAWMPLPKPYEAESEGKE